MCEGMMKELSLTDIKYEIRADSISKKDGIITIKL